MTTRQHRKKRWATTAHERALRGMGPSTRIGPVLGYDPSSVRAMWSGDPARMHPDLKRVLEHGLGLTQAGLDVRPLALELYQCAAREQLVEAEDADVVQRAVFDIDGENEADSLEDTCPVGTPIHAHYLYRAGLACFRAADGVMECAFRGLPLPDRWAAHRLEVLR